MAYYTSETCGEVNGSRVETGCTTVYEQSEVKYAVDAWASAQASAASEARLITVDEVSSLGYEWKQTCPTFGEGWVKTDEVPNWLYNSNYKYWISSRYSDSSSSFWAVYSNGELSEINVFTSSAHMVTVRPVIVLPKSALTTH